MTEREQLEQAIAHMEAQRTILGDTAVDAALTGLRQKLAALKQVEEAAAPSLAGERKLVTIMFADISGFTALAETMDPEAVRDMMNGCFERLVPIVDKYGGTVDKFIGDEIMALFGAPVAHENDPERALRAALDMMDALAEFNTEQTSGKVRKRPPCWWLIRHVDVRESSQDVLPQTPNESRIGTVGSVQPRRQTRTNWGWRQVVR